MRRMAGIVLAFGLATSPAQAGWKIDRAQAIAAKVWHHPCGGHVTLTWADLPADEIAAAAPDRCLIVYSRAATSWVEFCTMTIHEYGHLAGFRDPGNTADPYHSSNPHSVMYASQMWGENVVVGRRGRRTFDYVGLDRRCADRGRIYLGMKPNGLAKRERFSYSGSVRNRGV